MLRSLYSGISGLKVHQTAMDVIGNNISNVNTIGFKSSKVNFSDILYQTSQSATGASEENGKAGTNPMSVGLGAAVAAISTNMTAQGGAQRTDNALDIMINGTAFFIVSQGGVNYFTKNGAFTIDGEGNLANASGALVMGWQVDPDNANNIVEGAVTPLKIYSPENMYIEPEATTDVYFEGNVDQNDEDFEKGKYIQMEFYDSIGNKYTALYEVVQQDTVDKNLYDIELTDIRDSDGLSIFVEKVVENGMTTYKAKQPQPEISFGGSTFSLADTTDDDGNTIPAVDPLTGEIVLSGEAAVLEFNASTGKFVGVSSADGQGEAVTLSITTGMTGDTSSENLFRDIDVDFSSLSMYEDGGNSSITASRGNRETGLGAGSTIGTIKGVSVSTDGRIYATYDNGSNKLLGQIAVTTFTNPSALEAVGNSLFQTTQNSGEFDGIGSNISAIGLSMSTGVLEMSNVDLSTEFTNMITTQRGFQANSRTITTSDTLLEELINLKR